MGPQGMPLQTLTGEATSWPCCRAQSPHMCTTPAGRSVGLPGSTWLQADAYRVERWRWVPPQSEFCQAGKPFRRCDQVRVLAAGLGDTLALHAAGVACMQAFITNLAHPRLGDGAPAWWQHSLGISVAARGCAVTGCAEQRLSSGSAAWVHHCSIDVGVPAGWQQSWRMTQRPPWRRRRAHRRPPRCPRDLMAPASCSSSCTTWRDRCSGCCRSCGENRTPLQGSGRLPSNCRCDGYTFLSRCCSMQSPAGTCGGPRRIKRATTSSWQSRPAVGGALGCGPCVKLVKGLLGEACSGCSICVVLETLAIWQAGGLHQRLQRCRGKATGPRLRDLQLCAAKPLIAVHRAGLQAQGWCLQAQS